MRFGSLLNRRFASECAAAGSQGQDISQLHMWGNDFPLDQVETRHLGSTFACRNARCIQIFWSWGRCLFWDPIVAAAAEVCICWPNGWPASDVVHLVWLCLDGSLGFYTEQSTSVKLVPTRWLISPYLSLNIHLTSSGYTPILPSSYAFLESLQSNQVLPMNIPKIGSSFLNMCVSRDTLGYNGDLSQRRSASRRSVNDLQVRTGTTSAAAYLRALGCVGPGARQTSIRWVFSAVVRTTPDE